MPYPVALPLLASAARSASGVGAAADLAPVTTPATPPRTSVALTLRVDDLSGTTPSLAVSVETSDDQVYWTTLGTFTARTSTGAETRRFPGAQRHLRAAWTLGGTGGPSATFGVAGSALYVLATPADLDAYGINPDAFKNVSLDKKDRALGAATVTALRILGRRYTLPLTTWEDDVREAVAQLASVGLLWNRGLGPEDQKALATQKKAALDALDQIANEKADPQGMIVDATPGEYDAGAFVSSRPRRGWLR